MKGPSNQNVTFSGKKLHKSNPSPQKNSDRIDSRCQTLTMQHAIDIMFEAYFYQITCEQRTVLLVTPVQAVGVEVTPPRLLDTQTIITPEVEGS